MKSTVFKLCIKNNKVENLVVSSFEGEEQISKLYKFDLYVNYPDPHCDPKKFIAQKAAFSISDGTTQLDRVFNGVICQVLSLGSSNTHKRLKFTLVPALYKLADSPASKMFLDTTVRDVVQETLGDVQHDYKLTGQYPTLPMFFRYQETSLTFLQRIMAREGLYYYFEQQAQGEKIIICDNNKSHTPKAEVLRVATGKESTHLASAYVINGLSRNRNLTPKAVEVIGYSIKTGRYPVARSGDTNADPYEIYTEIAFNEKMAQHYADIALQRFSCRAVEYRGYSITPSLELGAQYLIQDGRDSHKVLLTALTHKGGQKEGEPWAESGMPYYQNSFVAAEASVQYRPKALATPKIKGPLPACITECRAASAEEPGKYKICLETEKNCESNWLVLAQYANHENTGMSFNLEKDTRVLVRFCQGNPDLPFIQDCIVSEDEEKLVTANNHWEHRIKAKGSELMLSDGSGTIEKSVQLKNSGSSMTLADSGVHVESKADYTTMVSATATRVTLGGQADYATGLQSYLTAGPLSRICMMGMQAHLVAGITTQLRAGHSMYLMGKRHLLGKKVENITGSKEEYLKKSELYAESVMDISQFKTLQQEYHQQQANRMVETGAHAITNYDVHIMDANCSTQKINEDFARVQTNIEQNNTRMDQYQYKLERGRTHVRTLNACLIDEMTIHL